MHETSTIIALSLSGRGALRFPPPFSFYLEKKGEQLSPLSPEEFSDLK
jgi:hypothetical protein